MLDTGHTDNDTATPQAVSILPPLQNLSSAERPSTPLPSPLPPVLPPKYIVFLKKEAFETQFGDSQTLAEKARQNIYGLQTFRADIFDRSSFVCADDEFRPGVVYQRLLMCKDGESYRYTAQARFADCKKKLKVDEFVEVLGLLGAKSINLKEEISGDLEQSGHFGCSAWSYASFRGSASRARKHARTTDANYVHTRPAVYQPPTETTVNLADYYYQDEWRRLIKSRLLPNAREQMFETVRIATEMTDSINFSLTIKQAGLDVGGDYKRTSKFDQIYEVHFWCPKDWLPQGDYVI